MKKVLILKGKSHYNVLRHWTDALAVGFEKQGVEVTVFDLTYVNGLILKMYAQQEYDAVIAFNGYFIESEYINLFNCPYIYVLIDHPIDHTIRIDKLRSDDILTIVDRNDINAISRFCKMPNYVYLLPHAAQEVNYLEYEKNIDVLFTGTYSNPEYFLEKWKESKTLYPIFKDIVEKCLFNSQLYYIDEIDKYFENKFNQKLKLNEGQLPIFIRDIGRYIYSKRRYLVLETILNSGIEVNIFGDNWSDSPFAKYENAKLHESVGYWKLLEVMKASKIVLNIAGIAYDGTHERVFSAMAAGSVCFSNETPFLRELFSENEELIFYSFNHIEEIPQKIQSLLENPLKMEKISENAIKAIEGKHTWNERAREIIEIFEASQSNND